MRVLRNNKGFYLIELLLVLVILAFIMLLLAKFFVWDTIDEARGSTLESQTRMVYYASQQVMLENKISGEIITDYDYEMGLTGAVNNPALIAQYRMSQRMNTLLAPDVVLADEPGETTSKATFTVENGIITCIVYEAMVGNRRYAVTMVPGGDTTVERIKD